MAMSKPSPDLPKWADEAKKSADLARMKRTATALLLGMTVLYFSIELSNQGGFWIGFVKAGAEAAMVGAIADWFAVTALFRHPLGIRIPHTAIIPNKKNSFGNRLGGFIQQNFLTSEVVSKKLASVQISRRTAEWLAHPDNSRTVADLARAGFKGILEVVRDEDVQSMIERGVLARVRSTQVAPIIGKLLDVAVSGPKQRELLIGLVKLLRYLVEENRSAIQRKIIDETPWWLPWSIDENVYSRILGGLEKLDLELVDSDGHPLQDRFDKTIQEFIERLKYEPAIIDKAEELKTELLNHPALQEFSRTLWLEIKASILRERTTTQADGEGPIERGMAQIGQILLKDEEMMAKIDGWIQDIAQYLMQSYGHEIGRMISDTVRQWDPDATSRKIELQVGRDLQFIRINGTIVGGLAGLLIHTISLLVH